MGVGQKRLLLLLLFLTLGAGWSTLARRSDEPPPIAAPRVVVTAPEIEAVRARFRREHGRAPSRDEVQVAVERLVRDAVLVHEARRLGLDRGDLVVQRRLLEKMAWLAPGVPSEPRKRLREALDLGLDRDDLVVRRRLVQRMEHRAVTEGGPVRIGPEQERSYYERHRDRFLVPRRYGFRHVFVHRETAADRLRATQVLAALRDGGPDPAAHHGDAFPLGTTIPPTSATGIASAFGTAFAEAITTAPIGRWHGPVESAFGWHLVRIEAVQPPAVRPFEEVRSEIRNGLRAAVERRRIERMVTRLLASSEVEVRWPSPEAAS